MAWIVSCIAGEAAPHRLALDGRLEIGRDPHCDLRLGDDRASRFHAQLLLEKGGPVLADNRSRNGSFVAGRRIERERLADGAVFTCGDASFVICRDDLAQGVTRVVSDDGTALQVTRCRSGPSAAAPLTEDPGLPALHRRLAATDGLRGRAETIADWLCHELAADRSAVVLGGSRIGGGMPAALATRLAEGGDARLLVLGRELVGQTIARQEVGSALTAPLGTAGHLVCSRRVEADAFGEEELAILARLGAELAPWFHPGASADELTELVGDGATMRDLKVRIARLAGNDTSVLITGASGTGKELVARALHRCSGRADGPFVAINCGAMAPGLIEAELFGHVAGAFTGAIGARPGCFRAADGGTLLLDEIGEMPLALQTRLLRVLQEGEVTPVGASAASAVNVRVLAATNRDLPAAVASGQFREDLYYRLDVLRIHLPALTEHREDIPDLVRHFLVAAARESGVAVPALADAALQRLQEADWPGNVRQLENTVRRALALAEAEIRPEHLELRPLAGGAAAAVVASGEPFPTLAEMEARHVLAALEHCDWNKTAAARLLGVSRPTIIKKVQDYGMEG